MLVVPRRDVVLAGTMTTRKDFAHPVEVLRVIEILEGSLGKRAIKVNRPMQPGDVPATAADVESLARDVGFCPRTPIEEGIRRFVAWYRTHYGV